MPEFVFPAVGGPSEEEIAAIKESLDLEDLVPLVESSGNPPQPLFEQSAPRRRGRPPGSKNRKTLEREAAALGTDSDGLGISLKPAPLTKREEREVAKRLQDILTGATGMAGLVKPYLPMTDEEAEAIAVPLASYLVRNEPTSGVAREILENYDLLAMTLGMGAYSMRVYRDRREEVATRRPANTTATQRVSQLQEADQRRQPDEGDGNQVSPSYVTRSGSAPFDL